MPARGKLRGRNLVRKAVGDALSEEGMFEQSQMGR